jgi:hypothetical protein
MFERSDKLRKWPGGDANGLSNLERSRPIDRTIGAHLIEQSFNDSVWDRLRDFTASYQVHNPPRPVHAAPWIPQRIKSHEQISWK